MYKSGKKILFDALITNYERLILDGGVLKKITWAAIISKHRTLGTSLFMLLFGNGFEALLLLCAVIKKYS